MRKVIACLLICCSLLTLQAQNVGVGTTTPEEKLHVAGNIKADTMKPSAIKLPPNAGTGKILTSDADGNASWQERSNTSGAVGFGAWGDCAQFGNISEYNPVAGVNGTSNNAFGNTVSMSGNYAVIGSAGKDIAGNNGQGSASIYKFNGVNWELMQELTDPEGEANDRFGAIVFISGNFIGIGVPQDDVNGNVNQGSVCAFQYDGNSWVFLQKLTDSEGNANDFFGTSVAVAGTHLIAGAYTDDIVFTDQGSILFFEHDGTGWVFTQKMLDPGSLGGDKFGVSVSLSGDYAIAGSFGRIAGGNVDQGSASIFQYNGTQWIWKQTITDPAGQASDLFGNSVSISGTTVVVGVPWDDEPAIDQGSAIIYRFDGTNWIYSQKLTDPDGSAFNAFGDRVMISGNYIIGGSYGDNIGPTNNQGSATIFQGLGGSWLLFQYIRDPMGGAEDFFGSSVAIDAATRRFLIGATGFFNGSNTGKAVFGKIN